MGFYIKRVEPDRWHTPSGGWTHDFRKAHRLATKEAAEFLLRSRVGEIQEVEACRRCNCTELDGCMDAECEPCCWVEKDLCSHCLTPVERKLWLAGNLKPIGGKP